MLGPEGLADIVEVLKSPALQLIFYYYFPTFSHNMQPKKLFETFFLEAYTDYYQEEKGWKGKGKHSWRGMQEQLGFIIGRIKKEINLRDLAMLLVDSHQTARTQFLTIRGILDKGLEISF